MVPPHLKSSYAVETQFVSPSRFKEEDIKAGTVELDDSMCRLLPGDKPRQKKDFGTTSYKKPGPPTPSKNGGRLSLQGGEVQPLREVNSTPKKVSVVFLLFGARFSLSYCLFQVTPNRIKALFKFKDAGGSRDGNSEVTRAFLIETVAYACDSCRCLTSFFVVYQLKQFLTFLCSGLDFL